MTRAERAQEGLHAHVLDCLQRMNPDRDVEVLDVGCGTGAMLMRLHAAGYRHLLGIDIKPPPALPGIRFERADLDRPMPIADASIDLILLVEVIEHVENVGLLLSELHRVLRPNGQILLTTPNVHSLEARIRWLIHGRLKQFDSIGDPTHLFPVFEHPFRKLLARQGLKVESSWGFPADGSSPTSRRGLRSLAAVARACGLKGLPSGDQWCLRLTAVPDEAGARPDTPDERKRKEVTEHYG